MNSKISCTRSIFMKQGGITSHMIRCFWVNNPGLWFITFDTKGAKGVTFLCQRCNATHGFSFVLLEQFWSISIYSLLNGLYSDLVLVVWFDCVVSVVAVFPYPSLARAGFQSAGFLWISQHVSQVWPVFLQWLHQDLFFLGRKSFPWFVWELQATRVEFSVIYGWLWAPKMTFLLLSSLLTSENTSRILGRGLMLMILPRTSSKFLFSPSRNW